MTNYYFDTKGIYTSSAAATEGTNPPDNALRIEPEIIDGFWAKLNEAKDGWMLVEDYRGREGFVNGEPYKIVDLGPLPEGWTDEKPEHVPTVEERIQAQLARIDAALKTLDELSMRPLRAVSVNGSEYDKNKLLSIEEEAAALRNERREITTGA